MASKKDTLEKTCLAFVCLIICSMLVSMLAYYYIKEYALQSNSNANMTEEISTCNTTVNSSSSIYATGMPGCSSEECTANIYTGSICREVLYTWKSCMSASNNEQNVIYIDWTVNQTQLEANAEQLIQYLTLATTECQEVILLIYCLYAFPICDCTTQNMYTPTKEICKETRDVTCLSDWSSIGNKRADILPDCDQLPNSNITLYHNVVQCKLENFGSSNIIQNPLTCTSSNTSNVMCRYDFVEEDGLCWPRCGVWTQDSKTVSFYAKLVEIIAALIGTLLTIICFGFVIYEYKVLFTFPAVFVTLIVIDFFISAIITILSLSDSSLFCSHIRLDMSMLNPSTFCTISGISFQYLITQMEYFWLCYITLFFYSTVYPFHAKRTKGLKKRRFIEILALIIGLVFPAIAVAIGFTIEGGSQYQQNSFPTIFCGSKLFTYWFYSFIVPNVIMLMAGSCLLVIIIYIVHKYQGLFIKRRRMSSVGFIQLTGAEKRLMWLLVSILIHGISAALSSIMIGANRSSFSNQINTYFACENEGHFPGKCDCQRYNIEKHSESLRYIEMLAYFLSGLLPLLALNFIINRERLCRRKTTPKAMTFIKVKSKSVSSNVASSHPKLNTQSSFSSILSASNTTHV